MTRNPILLTSIWLTFAVVFVSFTRHAPDFVFGALTFVCIALAVSAWGMRG